MWFVLFLFVFSLVGLPIFLWLRNGGGRRVVTAFARAARAPVLLIAIPVLILLLPWLQTEDDLSGQPPIGFFLLVLLGFVLMADERIGRVIDRHWVWLLVLGVAASVVYIWAEPRDWGGHRRRPRRPEAPLRGRRVVRHPRAARARAPLPSWAAVPCCATRPRPPTRSTSCTRR
jgi:hypothetical protein